MINGQQRTNYLIANIVDKMTQYMVTDFNLDITTSLNFIYNSKVYELVQDKENELYIQSPAYIYELLKKEYLTVNIAQSIL